MLLALVAWISYYAWRVCWYATATTTTLVALLVTVGDSLLTWAARRYGGLYVGKSIRISWSMLQGTLTIEHLALASSLRPMVGPMLGLPADALVTRIRRLELCFPWLSMLVCLVRKETRLPLRVGLFLDGLQIELLMDGARKWRWKQPENKARFDADVAVAKSNRLALLEWWTATILAKLALFQKPPATTSSTINECTLLASVWGDALDATLQRLSWPLAAIDAVLGSLALGVTNVCIVARPPPCAYAHKSTVTLQLEGLTLSAARNCDLADMDERQLELAGLSLRTTADATDDAPAIEHPMLAPFTISVRLQMPPIVMGLHHAPKDVRVAVDLSPLCLDIVPDQIQTLLDVLRPRTEHSIWLAQAIAHDEASCDVMTEAMRESYIADYRAKHMPETRPWYVRLLHRSRDAANAAARDRRLAEMEATALGKDVLVLRQMALGWSIPSFGDALPRIPDELKAAADLAKLIETPLEHYNPGLASPSVLAALHLTLTWPRMVVSVWASPSSPLLRWSMHALHLSLRQSMQPITVDARQLEMDLLLQSFGLEDTRQSPTNVFPHLVGRNPDCNHMLSLQYTVDGTATHVGLTLAHFSALVILLPFFEAQHAFAEALADDEETLVWRDADDLPAAQAPLVIYEVDAPKTFDPSLLGHMELTADVNVKGVEVCLLGDPSTHLSHQLAFTSDVNVVVKSTKYIESIQLTMIDVALQPCKIVLTDDGLDVTLPGLRTLLELEGDGVDLELNYELKMTQMEPSTRRLQPTHSSSTRAKGKWGLLQSAVKDAKITNDDPSLVGKTLVLPSASGPRVDATRVLAMKVSDFALNVSKDDIGLFAAIQARVGAARGATDMDVAATAARDARIHLQRAARLEAENMARLQRQFTLLDKDGGGTLDHDEIFGLLETLVKDLGLTFDEMKACETALLNMVDADRSGDISFDEFQAALDRDTIHYSMLHQGALPLTGAEYIHPKLNRSHVPSVDPHSGKAVHLAENARLMVFWTKYVEQTGATKSSLNGQSARVVQQKMVRTFKSYEFAQEAWTRLVNPALAKPSEQSPWLLLPSHVMGAGAAAFEGLFNQHASSVAKSVAQLEAAPTTTINAPVFEQTPVFVATSVSTSFGGFYFRVVDSLLPAHVPALELAFEEVKIHGDCRMYEGDDTDAAKRALNVGTGSLCGSIYCKYYNTKARQLEPFIEYYPLRAVLKKDVGGDLACYVVSDHYLHINLTSAFMNAVNATTAAFYESDVVGSKEREHVKVLGGLCWMHNELGSPLTYAIELVGDKSKLLSDRMELRQDEYLLCKLKEEESAMKGELQDNMKEKEMRKAFRDADADESGELEAHEVRSVLQSVLKSYASLSDADLEDQVSAFMALADTDNSGQVSWKEFQVALAKTRVVTQRTLRLEVPGFEPITGIPLDVLGQDMILDLVPIISDAPFDSDEAKYEAAVAYLNQDDPSLDDITRAVHLLRQLPSTFKWTASYLSTYRASYLPRLLAVHISVDSTYGMTVTISTAECIRNATSKLTQIVLFNADGDVSWHNPAQANSERFFDVHGQSLLRIPLPLLEHGSFAIRQVGEVEWSNALPLSVTPGRSLASPLTNYLDIDGQPTTIECHKGTWAIHLWPQLVVRNTLPCDVEYQIVQASDVPGLVLPPSTRRSLPPSGRRPSNGSIGSLASMQSSRSMTAPTIKVKKIKDPDAATLFPWFAHVNDVNARCGRIESGRSMQISGLDLDASAYMRVRLAVPGAAPATKHWSAPFPVRVQLSKKQYAASADIAVAPGDAPTVRVAQSWDSVRTVDIFAPYWVQNHSGLELKLKVHHGSFCSQDGHVSYFGEHFDKVPLLLVAPEKASLSLQPVAETPPQHDHQSALATHVRKYLPDFKRVPFSDAIDLAAVGTRAQVSCGLTMCVLGYEILAAPGQFQHTKILRLVPRFIIKNDVGRPLQLTPLTLHKGAPSHLPVETAKINVGLKPESALIVYKFVGKDSHVPGVRLRDALVVSPTLNEPGPWGPTLPLADKSVASMWLRGPLSDAPIVELDVQPDGLSTFVTLRDRTRNPELRIENRSTQYAIRYAQLGVKHAEEIVLPPRSWHSYAWDMPIGKDVRLKVYVGSSRVPVLVEMQSVHRLERLTPDDGHVYLHGEVYIDGITRVLAVGDGPVYHHDRRTLVPDVLFDMALEVGLHGLGVTIVDESPREIMNITMEGLRMLSPAHSHKTTYELHHMQLDDMTPHTMYPIFLAPIDSGFNSHKREGWRAEHGEHPWLHVVIDSYYDGDMLIVDELSATIGSLALKVNLDYALHVLDIIYSLLWPPQTHDEMVLAGVTASSELLAHRVIWPDPSTLGQNMYVRECSFSAYVLQLFFNSDPDAANSYLLSLLGNTAGSILGGIAHVTPEFAIHPLRMADKFVYKDDLIYNIILWDSLIGNMLGQWYKVVGSLELMGDPVGLLNEITDGLALAARQTKRDFKGESDKKGQGAVILMQTLVGAPSDAIGKAANGFGDILKKATYFENQEADHEPRHVPEGLLQGGVLLGKSLVNGVSGLVTKPMQGAKDDGFKGFAKGVGQGTLGLVASPLIGTLGVIEKLSQSVHNTTHLMDDKDYDGTRRIARKLDAAPLKSLSESNIISEMEVRIDRVTGLAMNYSVQVYVQLVELDGDGVPSRLVDKFKTDTLRNTAAPRFNQSRVVDVTSVDMALLFVVAHKRKPIPKKILGTLKLSIEDVYKHFHAMPSRFKSSTLVKEKLKSRKVHDGSLFTNAVLGDADEADATAAKRQKKKKKVPTSASSTAPLSTNSEPAWETTFNRASTLGSEMLLADAKDDDDRAESDAKAPSTEPLAFELEAVEGKPKIWLDIKYLNSMRT
ncbi:hypothetical protein SPRG_19573 [Saprolegnia parasitica CBS 223.65]|uniref:Uncharacterized protein n=1 Tax=Saprolegnia parasitica (strain CBS 223.65) TaxID=695850 RepID=A0A067CP73_SAPPC|nr:hypothetical protein SPRG_19573 [Saprolegnia parasitica CBS 223.65]KDO31045.1 hypothetical protein SPRG_19573 [Saprolegnia parasitica CBS 223.65]|eukprot:XP_012198306.1 hypothetical protein SPRG_19573 [Saprolegnia parasitica CBS 223.65]